ncbi:hypothetical protein ANO14919_142790 [Xylariales sp. No.14919]|nr:hypothetical protein ANO14919_142790 [Xylariales sp. No.14919]
MGTGTFDVPSGELVPRVHDAASGAVHVHQGEPSQGRLADLLEPLLRPRRLHLLGADIWTADDNLVAAGTYGTKGSSACTPLVAYVRRAKQGYPVHGFRRCPELRVVLPLEGGHPCLPRLIRGSAGYPELFVSRG